MGYSVTHMLLSVFFHTIIGYNYFDFMFTSELKQSGSVSPILPPTGEPPAHRVVLMTIDSASADVVFSAAKSGNDQAPFIEEKLQTACWGVSHVTGPTQTRPTHVSMFAGVGEDPANIRNGWRTNYKPVDTIMRRASSAWMWGYSETVKMSQGQFIKAFPAPRSNAATPNGVDDWVVTNASAVLRGVSDEGGEALRLLKRKGAFFYFHFLGLDTLGHNFGEGSSDYMMKLTHVDRSIKNTVEFFNNFFGDDRTAFIITSDHGMDGKGHEGASPKETRTPFIAWGSGINTACDVQRILKGSEREEMEITHAKWGLRVERRYDIMQRDVSMLIPALLAVPFPANSEGLLPTQYMMKDKTTRAHALYSSIEHSMNRVKAAEKYWLTANPHFLVKSRAFKEVSARYFEVTKVFAAQDYEAVIEMCQELAPMFADVTEYYRSYNHFFVTACITVCYAIWILYSFSVVAVVTEGEIQDEIRKEKLFYDTLLSKTSSDGSLNKGSFIMEWLPTILCLGMIAGYSLLRHIPLGIVGVFVLPCLALSFIKKESAALFKYFGRVGFFQYVLLIVTVVVLTYGFYNRAVYFVLCFGLAMYTVCFFNRSGRKSADDKIPFVSCIMIVFLGAFTLLPTTADGSTLNVSGAMSMLPNIFCHILLVAKTDKHKRQTFQAPALLWSCAVAVVLVKDFYLPRNTPHPLGWVTMALMMASFLLPVRGPSFGVDRLEYFLLCMQTPTTLLAVGYESLFAVILCTVLLLFARRFRTTPSVILGPAVLALLGISLFSVSGVRGFGTLTLGSLHRFPPLSRLAVLVLIVLKALIPIICVGAGYTAAFEGESQHLVNAMHICIALADCAALYLACVFKLHGTWKAVTVSVLPFCIVNFIPCVLICIQAMSLLLANTFDKKEQHFPSRAPKAIKKNVLRSKTPARSHTPANLRHDDIVVK